MRTQIAVEAVEPVGGNAEPAGREWVLDEVKRLRVNVDLERPGVARPVARAVWRDDERDEIGARPVRGRDHDEDAALEVDLDAHYLVVGIGGEKVSDGGTQGIPHGDLLSRPHSRLRSLGPGAAGCG